MRRLILISVCLVGTAVALAQAPGRNASPGARMQMRQEMQSQLEQMQQHMERIHSTRDPQERQRLMQEHMQSMREGMNSMMSMPAQGRGSPCAEGDRDCQIEEIQAQQRMMQQMMQQMMEHMMQHMGEGQAEGAPGAAGAPEGH